MSSATLSSKIALGSPGLPYLIPFLSIDSINEESDDVMWNEFTFVEMLHSNDTGVEDLLTSGSGGEKIFPLGSSVSVEISLNFVNVNL